jgi:hypothetical protein
VKINRRVLYPALLVIVVNKIIFVFVFIVRSTAIGLYLGIMKKKVIKINKYAYLNNFVTSFNIRKIWRLKVNSK